MNKVDLTIIIMLLIMMRLGYKQGLIGGVFSLVGFGSGAYLGSRIAPLLHQSTSVTKLAAISMIGAMVGGLLGATILEKIGKGFSSQVPEKFHGLDKALGSLMRGGLGIGVIWLLTGALIYTQYETPILDSVKQSVIVRSLNDTLPPVGTLINGLTKFSPFLSTQLPTVESQPVDRSVLNSPAINQLKNSIVRIEGSSCGYEVQGTGWVIEPGFVVTNAHVVAGEQQPRMQMAGEGVFYPANTIWFDPQNDIAILRVDMPAGGIPMAAKASAKSSAIILGYPEDGDYNPTPARLADTKNLIGHNIYGEATRRQVIGIKGRARPGNSGGPIISPDGKVVATIFATSPSSRDDSSYAVPNQIVRGALESAKASTPFRLGPCVPPTA